MNISSPCIITARLLPGIRIGDSFISIDYSKNEHEELHRCRYLYYIDGPNIEYQGDDISSGCNHSLQSGLASLLSFLGAAAESYAYDMRRGGDGTKGENSDLFPLPVVQWAHMNSDEISMYGLELEEGEKVIEE